MTMTQSLLDFILNLLRDSDAKAAFLANPQQTLADAGLSDVCSEDISDAMSYVAEYHPVSYVGEREYNIGNSAITQHSTSHDEHDGHDEPEHGRGDWEHHDDWQDHHPDPHASVTQQLEYITNNYAYTDSHDTVIDHSVNQSIWNTGELNQRFDDHSITATDHSIAAGHDIDGTIANGDHNIVGDHNDVGNTSYRDDHSQDNSIHDSFNGNNLADHGGVAGDHASGNVTNPHNSAVATNHSALDASTNDSHNSSISDSFNDSHNHTTHTESDLNYHPDNSHHTNINSGNHQSFNDDSYNHQNHNSESFNTDSAISNTHQEGLINANISPNVNLPIHDNHLDLLTEHGG